VRRIKGLAEEAVVIFDSDRAGRAAAVKSLPLFLDEGLSARAVVLPEGHDPDSFVNERGLKPFLEKVDGAPWIFDFYLDQKMAPGDLSVEGKVGVLKEIVTILSKLRSRPQQALYARRLSDRMGVKEEIVLSELADSARRSSGYPVKRDLRVSFPEHTGKRKMTDFQILNLLLHHPETGTVARLIDCECGILLSDPAIEKIVETFFQKYQEEGPFSPEELEGDLENEEARSQFRETLIGESFYADHEVEQAIADFERKAYQKKLSDSFKKAREKGDLEMQNKILKQIASEKTTHM